VRLGRKRFVDFIATREVSPASNRRQSWIVSIRRISFATVGVAAAAAAVVFWTRLPISFQIDSDAGPAAVAGNAGDLIEANAVVPTALRFSEGSSIVLEHSGQLRVLALASNGARVLVEKGSADVAIAHRHGPGKWRFEAGPVTVDVTGTRFRVDWNPDQRSFGIELKEGSVIVGGECLPVPRRVQRGENLHVTCGPAAPKARTTAEAEPQPAAPAIAPGPVETKPAAPAHAVALAHRESHAADDADWRALVGAGRYAEGVHAAERAGWSRVCRSANAVELLALADAARLSGETARAIEALAMLRQRFPGSSSAATAAFSLGRLAFEKRGAYTEAARWFATYLDEQPTGPLMGDAVGRLMEARQRSGDHSAARRDAERYLQRFPEGPYAGTARVILAE
jgi:TolA-binding protein